MKKQHLLKKAGVAFVAAATLGASVSAVAPAIASASVQPAYVNLSVNKIAIGDTVISGKGTPGDYININDITGKKVFATGNDLKIDASGHFSLQLPAGYAVQLGHTYSVSDSFNLKDVVYFFAGSFSVDTVKDGRATITGKGIPGHYININDVTSKKVLATGNDVKVDSLGNYSYTLPAGQTFIAGHKLILSDSLNLKSLTQVIVSN
ncbi:hypothetical protein HCB27_03785 [Listeria booriae]|uniref:Uncharacterized protein n=1 Tax=Listeria booriae TaxID=1552123 RepID=A0A7X1D7L1_9LIST|nr:hypothetical protein [Listeria booriae]MBC2175719.1 hypothetical protein [Listeria booriae]